MSRHTAANAVAAVAVGVLALAVALHAGASPVDEGPADDSVTPGPGYVVSVDPGLEPIMSAAQVVARATTMLDANAQAVAEAPPVAIQQVAAVRYGELGAREPSFGIEQGPGVDHERIVWVVRAEGPFVRLRGHPRAKPLSSDTGYIIIEDRTGEILGWGMP